MRVGSEKPAAAAAPRREHLTRVIAVVNGKGGVLKTSLTANVGGQLARRGFAVLLVDLDVSGNLKLDLGMRDPDLDDHGRGVFDTIMSGGATPLQPITDAGGRWSDEQFLITLNHCQADKAQAIAEALRLNIESAVIKHNNQTMNMTLSVGLSQYHVNDTVISLIDRVKTALAEAKALGNNRVVTLKAPYILPETVARQALPRFNATPVQMPV